MPNNYDDKPGDWSTDDDDVPNITPEQLARLRNMVRREVQSAIDTELTRREAKERFIQRVLSQAYHLFSETRGNLTDIIRSIVEDVGFFTRSERVRSERNRSEKNNDELDDDDDRDNDNNDDKNSDNGDEDNSNNGDDDYE